MLHHVALNFIAFHGIKLHCTALSIQRCKGHDIYNIFSVSVSPCVWPWFEAVESWETHKQSSQSPLDTHDVTNTVRNVPVLPGSHPLPRSQPASHDSSTDFTMPAPISPSPEMDGCCPTPPSVAFSSWLTRLWINDVYRKKHQMVRSLST